MTYRENTDAALAEERAYADRVFSDFLQAQQKVRELQEQLDALMIPVVFPGADLQNKLAALDPGTTVRFEAGAEYNLTKPLVVPAQITIQGQGAVVLPQEGTAVLDGLVAGPGVTLSDLSVRGFDRHGININVGLKVTNCNLAMNRKDGAGGDLVGAQGPAVVFEGCSIHDNGSEEWLGKGSGGIKFFHVYDSVVRGCTVVGNIGNGLWWDANCGYAHVYAADVRQNTRKGLFWEKCGASQIRGVEYDGMLTVDRSQFLENATENNGMDTELSIISSKNVLVSNSAFVTNQDFAIYVREDPDRIADDKPGFPISNVVFDNNDLNGSRIEVRPDSLLTSGAVVIR